MRRRALVAAAALLLAQPALAQETSLPAAYDALKPYAGDTHSHPAGATQIWSHYHGGSQSTGAALDAAAAANFHDNNCTALPFTTGSLESQGPIRENYEWAKRTGSLVLFTPSTNRMNLSSSMRATVSTGLNKGSRRSPTSFRTSSPQSCPCFSLITRKSSRST